ncbi:MAG: RNA polymerase sigma factor [Candidatus Paceibacteria bacterium]
MTDHEWQTQCEAAKAGDQQAYQALFDELEPRLYAYVRSRVFEAEQAADIVQETLIAFFKAVPTFTYTTTPQLYQYVFTIVRRQLAQTYENQKRQPKTLDETTVSEQGSSTVEVGAIRLDVASALTALDETAREIVVLHHWSRLSFKEIGVLLGIEEGAVRTRHHRAKEFLGTLLT